MFKAHTETNKKKTVPLTAKKNVDKTMKYTILFMIDNFL